MHGIFFFILLFSTYLCLYSWSISHVIGSCIESWVEPQLNLKGSSASWIASQSCPTLRQMCWGSQSQSSQSPLGVGYPWEGRHTCQTFPSEVFPVTQEQLSKGGTSGSPQELTLTTTGGVHCQQRVAFKSILYRGVRKSWKVKQAETKIWELMDEKW